MKIIAVDPGLAITGVAVLEGPTPTPGTPLNALGNRVALCRSLRSLPEGTDVERFRQLASQFGLLLDAEADSETRVIIEEPARANVYARTAARQRDKGSQMNMADVLRNVRLGGWLGATAYQWVTPIHFVKADTMKKKGRDGWLATLVFREGVHPPANEHERDALWLGLRVFSRGIE